MLYASWPKAFLGQESENHSAHLPSDPHYMSQTPQSDKHLHHGKKVAIFIFHSGEDGWYIQTQVSHPTLLLPWASTSDSSKADMAAAHSTPSSTGCLPSRDPQHTDPGCHHVSGCCSVPAAVKQGTAGDVLTHPWGMWADLTCFTSRVSRESLSPCRQLICKACTHLHACWRRGPLYFIYSFLPWQKSCAPMPLCSLSPSSTVISFEEKEKQAKEYVWNYLLWFSSRKWHTQESEYDPNFIVNLWKHRGKKSMLYKMIISFYH